MLLGIDDVLNWVWQGCVVAAVTVVALRLLHRTRAQARYVVCWAALITVLVLPVLPVVAAAVSTGEHIADPPAAGRPMLSLPDAWWTSATIVMTLWALWSSVYCFRMTAALISVRGARGNCIPFPSEAESRLRCWKKMSGHGRRTRLVLSNDVRSAAVLGCGSPVIGIAPALLEHLSDDELDGIVLHEWAHVQRRDDLVNVAHVATRAIAGWHPAVWWLERQLQIEREAACDEMAVAATGCPKSYAACLTAIASLWPRRPQPLPAIGALSSTGLSARVCRILRQKHLLSPRFSASVTLAAIMLFGGLSLVLAEWRLVATTTASALPNETIDRHSSQLPAQNDSPAILARVASVASSIGSIDAQRPRQPKAKPATARRNTEPTPDRAAASGSTAPATVSFSATDLSEPEPLQHVRPERTALNLPSTLAVMAPAATIHPPPADDTRPATPWGMAADGGIAVGRGSQKAAVATATFFSRLGKKVAGSF